MTKDAFIDHWKTIYFLTAISTFVFIVMYFHIKISVVSIKSRRVVLSITSADLHQARRVKLNRTDIMRMLNQTFLAVFENKDNYLQQVSKKVPQK